LGDKALLVSQDLFQFGSDFANKKTSRYKWDDPDNFDLARCAKTLSQLKNNQSVEVPNYDVVANKRIGTKHLRPRPVVVWEGIYAALTPELHDLADIIIYIETPYVIRLIRRVSRFLSRSEIEDMTVPARHMLSFVLWADIDYVATQKATANFIFDYNQKYASQDVSTLRQRSEQHMEEWHDISSTPLRQDDFLSIKFELYDQAFIIRDNSNQLAILYESKLDTELVQEVLPYWDRVLHY
jgi:uridine kinase